MFIEYTKKAHPVATVVSIGTFWNGFINLTLLSTIRHQMREISSCKRRFSMPCRARRECGVHLTNVISAKSNRPRRSAQNGVLETNSVLQEAQKRQRETSSPPFQIPSHIVPEKPWTYDHDIRDKRGESMFSAAVFAPNRPCSRTLRLKMKQPAVSEVTAGWM